MAIKIRIYPYKQGSKSAKALADALGGKVLRKVGSKYKQSPEDLIINWGASDCPYTGPRVANQPEAIKTASNKLTAFQAMKEADVSIPDFATDQEDITWKGCTFLRHKLTGHSGEGIEVLNFEPLDEAFPDAPLYVQYIKKQDEYRIHVLRKPGEQSIIISTQKKAKRRDADQVDYKIRNLANGFVYIRDGINPPEMVLEQARKAVEALGLAFGGVDVIWNERAQKAYVLEVNTAVGLEGQTVEDYANAFRNI